MLLEKYKDFIKDLIGATARGKLQWARGASPSSFFAVSSNRRRILIDTYNAQVDNTVNTCVNLAIFDGRTNTPVEEMVICDQASQMDDYRLINEFYQLVKKQYSDKEVNPILAEITQSLR